MSKAVKYGLQSVAYAAFAVFIGYFSTFPRYQHLQPDEALLRLSFKHPGKPVGECRERTPEELAKMAPNMRAAQDCPRERAPLAVELEFDGQIVYRRSVPPAGLRRDGAAAVHHRMQVPAGRHRVVARLRDHAGEGFNYVREATLDIAPGASLVIDFSVAQGGFAFKG